MTGARIALPRPWRARGAGAGGRRLGLPRPRRRTAMLAGLVALLLTAGWYWGRDLSLWSVNEVRITGATGPDAPQIQAALERAAHGMTTLHVRAGDLRGAVASFPVVRTLRVHARFPHGLRITVVENVPVAALSSNGRQVAVATDGTILRNRPLAGLPLVPAHGLPSGDRVRDAQAQGAIALAGAAPARLRSLIVRVRSGGHDGLRVDLHGGFRLVFGSRARLHAKWAAALRVMGDAHAEGATYLDLRIPERPVAGGALAAPQPSTAPAQGPASATVAPVDGAVASDPQATNPGNTGGEPPA